MAEIPIAEYPQTLFAFADQFLVICPSCQKQAVVEPRDPDKHGIFDPHVVICAHCNYQREWSPNEESASSIRVGSATDWYFEFPLWLQDTCCGELLWAHNVAHLDYIERAAHQLQAEGTMTPEAAIALLPDWARQARCYTQILHVITALRRTL
jgi:hypothetical protein